jgi:Zn-dependent M28 family amino/carboxypeptidase
MQLWKRTIVVLASMAMMAAAAPASDDLAKLRDHALASGLAWRLVASLTTEIGPRPAGSEADKRAVAWAVKNMKDLGFDKVWKEPVSFPTWVRGREEARILSPFPQPLHVTALGFSVGTGSEGMDGEVVHFRSLDDLEAVEDGGLQGKIAFISQKMERHRDGHGYGPVVKARALGPAVAARKGAIALLIRSVGTDNNRTPHTGMSRRPEGVPVVPAAALSNPDADLLVRELSYGKPVRVHLVLTCHDGPEATSFNVVGEITGREKPDEVVLIGGHLDSWDLGTGAIDDGAGVAVTMAAAKAIMEQGKRPRRSIRVVAFANEENGLWGAKAYAKAHASELPRHVMAGESDFGAGKIYALSVGADKTTRDWLASHAGALKPLGIEWSDDPTTGGPDVSPLSKAGVPVFELQQDGTHYFDWHHTANDTLDKIDPAALAQNTAAYAVLVRLLADDLPMSRRP